MWCEYKTVQKVMPDKTIFRHFENNLVNEDVMKNAHSQKPSFYSQQSSFGDCLRSGLSCIKPYELEK